MVILGLKDLEDINVVKLIELRWAGCSEIIIFIHNEQFHEIIKKTEIRIN